MPGTNTPCTDEDGSVAGEKTSMESKPSPVYGIEYWYEDDLEAIEDVGGSWRRQEVVKQWDEWCKLKYPDAEGFNWERIVVAAGEDVGIRLLIKGQSIADYAIMLFLEACYAVDKALCGTDMEAFAQIKEWHVPQEMRAYKYLLSDEMKQWLAAELGELENEIESPFSNRVSLSWRMVDPSRCVAKLEVVMECKEGIATNIWTTMGENSGSTPAISLHEAIFDRVRHLKISVEILCKALERIEQGDAASETVPVASHSGSRR